VVIDACAANWTTKPFAVLAGFGDGNGEVEPRLNFVGGRPYDGPFISWILAVTISPFGASLLVATTVDARLSCPHAEATQIEATIARLMVSFLCVRANNAPRRQTI